MKTRVLLLVLLVMLASPLWAWRRAGDPEALKTQYEAIVTAAIAESAKALEAGKEPQARYPLLAVSDLCVPGGGNSARVSDELVAKYKEACARAWASGAPDEKTFTATVKEYAPKLENAYLRASYMADNAETYSVSTVQEEFAKAAANHPAAVALAIEFSGKSLLPEQYHKYIYSGDAGSPAMYLQHKIGDIYGGPEMIRQMCQETFVPAALEQAEARLGNIDPAKSEPKTLAFEATMVENDFLKLVHWADPGNARGKELQGKVDALREKAKAMYAAEIKANRVPPDEYPGDDKAELKQQMKGVFKLQEGASIVRIVIPSRFWVEKANVWTGYNAIDVGWYKLLEGAVVCKYADGTYWVHPVTFGRRWTGGGDKYGDLMVFGWADRYEILPAYVNK